MLWPVSDHNAGGPDWNRPGAQHKKLTQDFRSQRPPQTRLVINSELLVLRTPVVPTGDTRDIHRARNSMLDSSLKMRQSPTQFQVAAQSA